MCYLLEDKLPLPVEELELIELVAVDESEVKEEPGDAGIVGFDVDDEDGSNLRALSLEYMKAGISRLVAAYTT